MGPKKSMIPVRCYTCNKVLGHLEETIKLYKSKYGMEIALNKLKLTRMCCRMRMITYTQDEERICDFEFANSKRHIDDNSEEYIQVSKKRKMENNVNNAKKWIVAR